MARIRRPLDGFARMQKPRHVGALAQRTGAVRWLSVLLLALAGHVAACEIPVFRYALEHWQVKPCRIIVFHQGELAPAHRQLGDVLGQSNLFSVETCDLALPPKAPGAPSADQLDIWGKQPLRPPLPALTLCCWGGKDFVPEAVWTRSLAPSTVDALTRQMPLHRELARRLLAGDSAVWVLLSSPDAAKNAAARKMLGETLAEMERTLKLPHEVDPNDATYNQPLSPNVALKLHFSVLEIPGRGLESDLIRCAVRTVTTNAVTTTEPVVIPVFGRGLALDAFSGPVLDRAAVRSVCEFLCGSCSCMVKEMRPGVSLFIPADWDAGVAPSSAAPEPLPPLLVPGATPRPRR